MPLMSDINKFLALKTALLNEKAKLEARLAEISKVLGQDVSVPTPSPEVLSLNIGGGFSILNV